MTHKKLFFVTARKNKKIKQERHDELFSKPNTETIKKITNNFGIIKLESIKKEMVYYHKSDDLRIDQAPKYNKNLIHAIVTPYDKKY